MSEQPIFNSTVDAFVLLAYLLTVATAAWLAFLFHTKRSLFVKPSVILLLWTHVLFQWPSAVYASYYETVLPDPYTFLLLIHGFVLIGLLGSQATVRKPAEDVLQRVIEDSSSEVLAPSVALLLYCGVVIAVYLAAVPISKTGHTQPCKIQAIHSS